MKYKAKIIAFYLPQFHPIPENNKWWGKGFTEWTNVGRAKPLYKGHYQPRVPADLGYYDLRMPEIREEQAKMAKEAGIEGFCYWHYWFGEGKQLLERPFNEVLISGKPDFPFCLGWANESWEDKLWNANGSKENKLLIEQKYPGVEDNKAHFLSLLKAFKDERYIKVDGQPLFFIYKPEKFKDIHLFIQQWNDLAQNNGLNKFYFVAQAASFNDYNKIVNLGFDSIIVSPMRRLIDTYNLKFKLLRKIDYKLRNTFNIKKLNVIEYKKAIKLFINKNEDSIENVIPTLMPNWDHSPRSGNFAWILKNAEPEYFKEHISNALECVKDKPEEKRIIFLKSWNEWAEGNYMEPDLKYGTGYLDALKTLDSND